MKTNNFIDISQIQKNVSMVREWFTEGIDEATLFFAKFSSVCKSGHYSMLLVDEKRAQRETHSREYELALQYSMKRDGSTLNKELRGHVLAEFILHVGLIQHESDDIAEPVAGFLQQHQIVTKAVQTFMDIGKAGHRTDIDQFECKVGDMEEAEALLKKSQIEMETCAKRLNDLRRLNPITLLFRTEELYQLSESLVANTGENAANLHTIGALVSRIVGASVPSPQR
jgi:hypothetical protein